MWQRLHVPLYRAWPEIQLALTLSPRDSLGLDNADSVLDCINAGGRRLAPHGHLDEVSRSGLRKGRSDSPATSNRVLRPHDGMASDRRLPGAALEVSRSGLRKGRSDSPAASNRVLRPHDGMASDRRLPGAAQPSRRRARVCCLRLILKPLVVQIKTSKQIDRRYCSQMTNLFEVETIGLDELYLHVCLIVGASWICDNNLKYGWSRDGENNVNIGDVGIFR
jgi:hypothetical protein